MPPSRVCSICDRTYSGVEGQFCPEDGGPLIAAADAIDPMIGRDIGGRYRIARLLGKGGMGAVYYARQMIIDRPVAVKVLRSSGEDPQGAARRFVREARLAASLSHPNIVTIHDFGQEPDGTLYVVMEFLEGRDLGSLIAHGPLQVERAARIGAAICDALAHAHGKGIVHRDIKPENVVVTQADPAGDRLKVVDFGLARSLEDASSRITATGVIFGTAAYISPEVAVGRSAGPGADLYALGVLLYELVEWRLPFPEDNPNALLVAHASRPPTPMSDSVPDDFRAIISGLLEKDPAVRPSAASVVRDQLLAFASGSARVPHSGWPGAGTPGAARSAPAAAAPEVSGRPEGHDAPREAVSSSRPVSPPSSPGFAATGPVLGAASAGGTSGLPARQARRSRPWRLALFGGGVALAGLAAGALVVAPTSPEGSGERVPAESQVAATSPAASGQAVASSAGTTSTARPSAPAIAPTGRPAAELPAPPSGSAPGVPPTAAETARPAVASPAPIVRWVLEASVPATVLLDGAVLGTTPLTADLPSSSGVRTFVFESRGYRTQEVERRGDAGGVVRAVLPREASGGTPGGRPSARPRVKEGFITPD
jgi:serine/threonine protein kinase